MKTFSYRATALAALALLGACTTTTNSTHDASIEAAELPAPLVSALAELALDCVHKEYPNVVLHRLGSDADVAPPSTLYPAFYGCFDWHSSVHGHWLLARIAHLYPDNDAAPAAREALFVSLSKPHVAGELRYLRAPGRTSFERPYGLAWLLQLHTELGDWAESDDALAGQLKANLEPLVEQSLAHLLAWLPKLGYPVRTGTHGQTAFALGLMLDWASAEGRTEVSAALTNEVRRLYLKDEACPLRYEPSGHDFLSACIAEADLLRRVLDGPAYSRWLRAFLPQIPTDRDDAWLPVASVTDPTDGHLVHLDGLNLSRAWMLEGVASALQQADPRRPALLRAVEQHRSAGIASIVDPHYAGGHWLGSFATYLVTRRGITQQ